MFVTLRYLGDKPLAWVALPDVISGHHSKLIPMARGAPFGMTVGVMSVRERAKSYSARRQIGQVLQRHLIRHGGVKRKGRDPGHGELQIEQRSPLKP